MLELGRTLAILRDCCPVIGPCRVPSVATDVEHGLDGEHMARLHDPYCLVLAIMRNIWRAVEELTNPMTAVACDHTTATFCSYSLNHAANISVEGAWTYH